MRDDLLNRKGVLRCLWVFMGMVNTVPMLEGIHFILIGGIGRDAVKVFIGK